MNNTLKPQSQEALKRLITQYENDIAEAKKLGRSNLSLMQNQLDRLRERLKSNANSL